MSIKKLLKLFLLFFALTIFDSKANVVPVEKIEAARGLVLKFAQFSYDFFAMNDRTKEKLSIVHDPKISNVSSISPKKLLTTFSWKRILAIKKMEVGFDETFKELLAKYSFIVSQDIEESDFAEQILAVNMDLYDFCKILGISVSVKKTQNIDHLLSALKNIVFKLEAFIKSEGNTSFLKKIFWGSSFSYNALPWILRIFSPIIFTRLTGSSFKNDFENRKKRIHELELLPSEMASYTTDDYYGGVVRNVNNRDEFGRLHGDVLSALNTHVNPAQAMQGIMQALMGAFGGGRQGIPFNLQGQNPGGQTLSMPDGYVREKVGDDRFRGGFKIISRFNKKVNPNDYNPSLNKQEKELLELKLSFMPKMSVLTTLSAGMVPMSITLPSVYKALQTEDYERNKFLKEQALLEKKVRVSYATDRRTSFKDIIGYAQVKANIQEIINVLRDPIRYIRYGVEVPKGVLLYGPPGCGKTMFARAIATEADCFCIVVSASDLLTDKDHSSEEKINKIFENAEFCAPSILFIDEIDFIAQRDKGEGRKTLATLLTKLSGFKPRNPYRPVLVIAATNKFDELDSALIRAGRFDLHLELPHPDSDTRLLMFEKELVQKRDLPLDESLPIEALINSTKGFNFADIVALCNVAKMKAVLNKQTCLTMENFKDAFKQKEIKP